MRLDLKADGTFAYRMESHVMYVVLLDAKGRYRVQGPTLILKGKQHAVSDDGYRKGIQDGPFQARFRIEKDGLVQPGMWKGSGTIYRRVGAGPPPDPVRPKSGLSSPAAVALLRRVEARYANLRSYADEGTVVSNGEGFQPTQVRFTTRFVALNRLRFEASLLDGKRAYERHAFWTEGRTSWLYESDSGSAVERTLANGLGILAVSAGQEATLVPELLMPQALRATPLSAFPEIRAKPDAGGLAVIELWKDGERVRTLWIDRKTLLVRRARLAFADERIDYRPRANVAIPAAELVSKAPRRRRLEP